MQYVEHIQQERMLPDHYWHSSQTISILHTGTTALANRQPRQLIENQLIVEECQCQLSNANWQEADVWKAVLNRSPTQSALSTRQLGFIKSASAIRKERSQEQVSRIYEVIILRRPSSVQPFLCSSLSATVPQGWWSVHIGQHLLVVNRETLIGSFSFLCMLYNVSPVNLITSCRCCTNCAYWVVN